MVAQIGDDGFAPEPADDVGVAQHRAAHRLVGKGALLEMVEDDVGGDVERERHILLQHLGVIGRAFARGIGVEVAADRLDLLGDRAGAAPLGALERHVLEEMSGAVDLRRLVPGPDIDPEAERGRIHRIDPVGDDPEPVGERRLLYGHAAPRFGCVRRAWARTNRATAPTSLGRMVIRSRLSMSSMSAGGTDGRMPVARSTASGNFAGWAVASATIGIVPSPSAISARAAATATAVCGSISTPEWR